MNTVKNIRKIAYGLIFLSCLSCSNYLDKESTSLITPDQVWNDPVMINAVLVNLYSQMEYESFNYFYGDNWRIMNTSTMSDEAQGSYQKDPMNDNANSTYTYSDDLFDNYSSVYSHIRSCNDFLEQLKTATLSDSEKLSLNAEVRFIRAWHYFTLVKRYGGVPLITEAQQYEGVDKLSDLQVPRNKEEEIYTFITSECNEIATNLPTEYDVSGKYRANKGAALALCSRAALYAGSIAKYGKVDLDGIVGISSSQANHFFQIAFDTSKAVIDLGVYFLYNNKPNDKTQNFCDMFLKGNGDNGEYIFQKQYSVAGGIGHDFDVLNIPFSYRNGGWGCGVAPTLELVEAYEYTDGTIGTLKLTDDSGNPIKYSNTIDIFAGKDPRLFASIYLPGSACKGSFVEWQRGLINSAGEEIAASKQPDSQVLYTDAGTGKTYSVSGKDGGADIGDPSKTGFYQKKFIDETLANIAFGKSETPRPVFRLAEMYLNLAEAGVELGTQNQVALDAINKIRERAGIALLPSIDITKVRHERQVELAFEGQRFWDLKRWRVASLDVSKGGLNGFRGSALYPWYDIKSNKYVFKRGIKPPKEVRVFLEKNYYTKISSSDMNSNPKLFQNPGYTN